MIMGLGGWLDVSLAAKSTYGAYKRMVLDCQHPHGCSSATPFLKDTALSSGLFRPGMHTKHMHICRQILMHLNEIKIRKMMVFIHRASIDVFIRLSIAMIKHHDHKHVGEKRGFCLFD